MPIKKSITIKGLKKSFGKDEVLKGINLEIQSGTMMALLGPNGAGKTTTVRIISTLLPFDSGKILIEGFDLKEHPDKIRTVIGLTGQSAAVDELLTGRENLIMMGRLYRLTKSSAKQRAEELLEDFDLIAAADRPAKTYSGGMRRRLDLAVSLIASPPIIFLDEPTTGLDPRSRLTMWKIIEDLKKNGATILLTTQYLEEADQLADRIAVIDGGKVIAEGTSKELKKTVGNDRLVIAFSEDSFSKAKKMLSDSILDSNENERTLTINLKNSTKDTKLILEKIDNAGLKMKSLDIHKPTLDDVFLSLTGKKAVASKKDGK
jgi:ABC-2 type transport system ATP-binding protein